jgi:hypothetical protein
MSNARTSIDLRPPPEVDASRPSVLARSLAKFARDRLRPAAGPMEKRAFFTNHWLGIGLIVPQLLLIFTFFYWPAGEALFWAFTL